MRERKRENGSGEGLEFSFGGTKALPWFAGRGLLRAVRENSLKVRPGLYIDLGRLPSFGDLTVCVERTWVRDALTENIAPRFQKTNGKYFAMDTSVVIKIVM